MQAILFEFCRTKNYYPYSSLRKNADNLINIKAPLNKVVEEGSRSTILPVNCAEKNHKSSGRSGILVDSCNLSTTDAMRNTHIQESTIRLSNYYSIE
jgi:hypothetical protein